VIESAEWENSEWDTLFQHRRGTSADRPIATAGRERLAAFFDGPLHRRLDVRASLGQADARLVASRGKDILETIGGFSGFSLP